MIWTAALLCAALAGCAVPASTPGGEQGESAPQEIPLAYTQDYVLFSGGTDADGNPLVGLMDRDRREILPAVYREISVAENGVIFASGVEDGAYAYQIFTSEGEQMGGDYAFIECASPGGDGVWVYRQASYMEMRPVPPYIAYTQDDSEKRSYWLLDENALPTEAEPYDDMALYDDGGMAKCRDGILYHQAADGTVTQSGGEVQTYFCGKYQVKLYYPGVHGMLFSLWDQGGNQIAPPEYSTIQVPFEDRYVLYQGSRDCLGGEQAFLYDDTGRLLADNSNRFSFELQPDGRYFGISYIGNPYDEYAEVLIFDEAGNPEPQGAFFVDKNGQRLSERYKEIQLYENEAQLQETAADTDNGSFILKRIGGAANIAGAEGLRPEEPFFLVLTTNGDAFRLPLKSVLLDEKTTEAG